MPIYEFNCKPCKDKFELLISSSKIPDARCPKCGSAKVERIFSTFFSGSSGGASHSSSHGSNCAGCSSGRCSSCSH